MWVSDGSNELSISENRVTCQVPASAGGDVYNAIWKDGDGLQGGKAYWKLTLEGLEKGSLFAGVTDLEKFKKGWGCKGLFYGGNLSDGGGLLVGNFGPRLKAGDVLGIYVNFEGDKLQVCLDVNGTSLGVAFDVPKETLRQVYPAVHFSGSGALTIQQSMDFPTSTTRQPEKFEGLQGNWKYASGLPEADAAAANPINLELRAHCSGYRGNLRVLNNISVNVSRQGPDAPWLGQTGGSTMMGGPPEIMNLEQLIIQHVSGTFSLNEGSDLMSIVNGGKTSVWSRYTPEINPVTTNPFLY